jgi:hypothetical protein
MGSSHGFSPAVTASRTTLGAIAVLSARDGNVDPHDHAVGSRARLMAFPGLDEGMWPREPSPHSAGLKMDFEAQRVAIASNAPQSCGRPPRTTNVRRAPRRPRTGFCSASRRPAPGATPGIGTAIGDSPGPGNPGSSAPLPAANRRASSRCAPAMSPKPLARFAIEHLPSSHNRHHPNPSLSYIPASSGCTWRDELNWPMQSWRVLVGPPNVSRAAGQARCPPPPRRLDGADAKSPTKSPEEPVQGIGKSPIAERSPASPNMITHSIIKRLAVEGCISSLHRYFKRN